MAAHSRRAAGALMLSSAGSFYPGRGPSKRPTARIVTGRARRTPRLRSSNRSGRGTHPTIMLAVSAEARVRACWARTATVAELVELLDDNREWAFGGQPSFDGDATTIVCVVSESAIHALAEVAPTAAPPTRLAAAVLRLHDRVREIQMCTWASPLELRTRWTSRELAPFGKPLVDALRAALDDEASDVRRRATAVLADLGVMRDDDGMR
jgi:hypothetical protein